MGIIGLSIYINMHASTSTSELDIEISSIEHYKLLLVLKSYLRQALVILRCTLNSPRRG